MDIPTAWETLDPSGLQGRLMIIGAPDVGKSTFARYLFQRLCAAFAKVALLDGDPGQNTLGPPATMTLSVATRDEPLLTSERTWRVFIGALSPSRHMLQILTGAGRLMDAVRQENPQAIIYDTSGMVGSSGGGQNLKLAQIELLRPTVLFALQRNKELESLLLPLRRSRRVKVIELPLSSAAMQQTSSYRRARRAANFERFFTNAAIMKLAWSQFAVLPKPHFIRHQLVGFEDEQGFLISLGIVERILPLAGEIEVLTPLHSLHNLDVIRISDVRVDPKTFSNMTLSL